MTSRIVAATAAALLLGLSAPAFAQSFTLNGTDVPPDQVERLQAHCDALEASEMGSAADSSSEASGSTDATAGTATGSADITATGTAATESGSDAATTTPSAAADSTSGSVTATRAGPVDFATLDLATIDIEACRQGGFLHANGGEGASGGTTRGTTGSTSAGSEAETTTSN